MSVARVERLRASLRALHAPRFQPRAAQAPLWGELSDEQVWRERLRELFMGLKVAVWGAAKSGVAAANLLAELGAEVTLSDSRSLERPQDLHASVTLISGQLNSCEGAELLIPSPGLKPTHPLLQQATAQGVPLMSEVELGAWATRARLVAITGTDGKSTCTTLIAHLLNELGVEAWGVGNLGEPVCVRALSARPEQALVCEVSAFQLWSSHAFPAELGLITNIAEDHLDYFDDDFAPYRDAKLRLIGLCAEVGGATLTTREVSALAPPSLSAHLKRFGLVNEGEGADDLSAWVSGEALLIRGEEVGSTRALPLIGRHNQLNLCAALLALTELGFEPKRALQGASTFKGLPHRSSLVRELGGVRWVNDSKATNVHAALAGLKSLDERVLLILGGKEKGLDYTPMIEHLRARAARGGVRAVLLIGELTGRLSEALTEPAREGGYELRRSVHLAQAVTEARALAEPGDMVLLAPASSSFDQFKSFEERGEVFEALVLELS